MSKKTLKDVAKKYATSTSNNKQSYKGDQNVPKIKSKPMGEQHVPSLNSKTEFSEIWNRDKNS